MESVYQPFLEQLIAFGSSEPKKPDLLVAKGEYFALTGEIFEDDKQFESRMASFLDYYLCDRRSPLTGRSPAQELYEDKQRTAPQDQVVGFRAFTETVHALFEVRKLGKGLVRLRELFSGKDYNVTERRQMAGLEKGDILEARLIPFGGMLLFSAAFTYHPREASKAIWREVKRRKKKLPQASPDELIWECAKRSLKVDRYRQIAAEKIYDFEGKTI